MNCTTDRGYGSRRTYPVDAPVTQISWFRYGDDAEEVYSKELSVRFLAYWIGYDGCELSEMVSPAFTTLLQLRDYLIANSMSPQSVMLELIWVDADNCQIGEREPIIPNPFA